MSQSFFQKDLNLSFTQAIEPEYLQAQITAPVAQISSSGDRDVGAGELVGGAAIVLTLVGLAAAIALIKTSLRICKPNEMLIISGRQYKQASGKSVGYRVVFGGRAFVIPILERVEKMDMTTMPIPVEVSNSYARGGTPLNIQAIANVKVSNQPGIAGNAIERFLGRNQSEIRRVVTRNTRR